MTNKQSEDFQLWLLLKKGDTGAFALLFEKYHPTLYNYGVKLTPFRPDLVEDAIQDLFIDLWRLRGGLTEKVESVRFYLYRSLRRKIHLLIQATGYEHLPVGAESSLFQDSCETDIIKSERNRMQSRKLDHLIGNLPKRQREALTLKYFEGFSNQDIAGIMNVSEKSVRNFLYKALSHLKAQQDLIGTCVFATLLATSL